MHCSLEAVCFWDTPRSRAQQAAGEFQLAPLSRSGLEIQAVRGVYPDIELDRLDRRVLSLSASERSLLSPTSLTCRVRLSVSGLYCSGIIRNTAEVSRSIITMPPLTSFGEFGKDIIVFNISQKGNIPAGLQEIGINYAVSHPIEGMENILNDSITKAPKNTKGERALQWALESYKGKQKEIDNLVETKVSAASVRQFAPSTRQLIYDKMQKLPDNRNRALGVDVNSLQEYKAILKPFPK
jgi:hypothetical protein